MNDPNYTFLVPVYGNKFLKPLACLIMQLEHFNPEAHIITITLPSFFQELNKFLTKSNFNHVKSIFANPIVNRARYWHNVIWLKLHALLLQQYDAVVVLDLDVLVFSNIKSFVSKFLSTNYYFAGSPDDDLFYEQFSLPLSNPLKAFANEKAFNAGTFMLRPSLELYNFTNKIAKLYASQAKFPEQAILNAVAMLQGGWMNLGDAWMLNPLSKDLDKAAKITSFVHLWTPRPAFFGLDQIREDEYNYEEFLQHFLSTNKKIFPEEYLKNHYQKFACGFIYECY